MIEIAEAALALLAVAMVVLLVPFVVRFPAWLDRIDSREDRRVHLLAEAQAVLGVHRYNVARQVNLRG